MKIIVSDADPRRYIERTQLDTIPLLNLLREITPEFARHIVGDEASIPKQWRGFQEGTFLKVKNQVRSFARDC